MPKFERLYCNEFEAYTVCGYDVMGHYVWVFFDKEWNPMRYTCDCPAYAMGKRCRHIVIVSNMAKFGLSRKFLEASGVEP